MKSETCKHYSRVYRIFLPNIVKIDPYNFELPYTVSKLGRFLRHGVILYIRQPPVCELERTECISRVNSAVC